MADACRSFDTGFPLQTNYNWRRYVLPTGTPLHLIKDMLPDPEEGKYFNPDVRSFEKLEGEASCIVLLGDTGIGKTDVFKRAHESIVSSMIGSPQSILIRTGDFSDDRLIEQAFEDPSILDWQQGNQVLSIFIDGLDEGILRGHGWTGIIHRKLEMWSRGSHISANDTSTPLLSRLRIRISCRPGLWPSTFEDVLRCFFEITGKHLPMKWDLLPLREIDIHVAAASEGLELITFEKNLEQAGAHHLASLPLGLSLILRILKQDATLPTTHVEMYRLGCKYLLDEHNTSRRQYSQLARKSADRRYLVAKRIAAMRVFGGKAFVRRTAAPEVAQTEDVLLSGDIEGSASNPDFSVQEIDETLDTPLFSFRDHQTLAWSHQNFLAFLCADWCVAEALNLRELRLLFFTPGEPSGVPPQLQWAAVWLSEIHSGFQRLIAQSTPWILLRSDPAAVPRNLRKGIVHKLIYSLLPSEQERLLMQESARFAYDGIDSKLASCLSNASLELPVRMRALEITIACKQTSISMVLARIVNAPHEHATLRRTAAFALAQFGSPKARIAIAHHAKGSPNDPDQDLQGYALSANWPGNLATNQMLSHLSEVHRTNYFGGYAGFLHELAMKIPLEFRSDDLIAGLGWLWNRTKRLELPSALDDVAHSIFVATFEASKDERVRNQFAMLLVQWAGNSIDCVPERGMSRAGATWAEALDQNRDMKLSLIKDCLREVPDGSPRVIANVTALLRLHLADVPVLIDWAMVNPESYLRPVSEVVNRFAHGGTLYGHIQLGVERGYLSSELRRHLETDHLDPDTRWIREDYELSQQRSRQAIRQPALTVSDLVARNMKPNGEKPDWGSFWTGCVQAMEKSGGWLGGCPVQRIAGWNQLNANTRSEVVDLAKQYLSTPEFPSLEVQGSSCPSWALAYFSALLLVARFNRHELRQDDDVLWRRHSMVALWFPFTRNDDEGASLLSLLNEREAPFAEAFANLLQVRMASGQYLSFAWPTTVVWAEAVEVVTMGVLGGEIGLRGSVWRELLEWALRTFPDQAIEVLSASVDRLTNRELEIDADEAAHICYMWVVFSVEDPWKKVAGICYESTEVGRHFLAKLEGSMHNRGYISRLGDASLGEMFTWVVRQTGYEIEDGRSNRMHVVRESLLAALKDRGNLQVFQEVLNRLPQYDWLAGYMADVREAHFKKSIRRISPKVLLTYGAANQPKWFEGEQAIYISCLIGLAFTLISGFFFLTEIGMLPRSLSAIVLIAAIVAMSVRLSFIRRGCTK